MRGEFLRGCLHPLFCLQHRLLHKELKLLKNSVSPKHINMLEEHKSSDSSRNFSSVELVCAAAGSMTESLMFRLNIELMPASVGMDGGVKDEKNKLLRQLAF